MYKITSSIEKELKQYIKLLQVYSEHSHNEDSFYDQISQTFSYGGLFIQAICILHDWDINEYYKFLLELKESDIEDDNLVGQAVCNWEHVLDLVDKAIKYPEDKTFKEIGNALEDFLTKYPIYYKLTPKPGHLLDRVSEYMITREQEAKGLAYYYGFTPLLETFSPKGSDLDGHYKYNLVKVHKDRTDCIEYQEIVFRKFYSNNDAILDEFVKTGKLPFDKLPRGYSSKCDTFGVRLQNLKTRVYQNVETKFCTEAEWRKMSLESYIGLNN